MQPSSKKCDSLWSPAEQAAQEETPVKKGSPQEKTVGEPNTESNIAQDNPIDDGKFDNPPEEAEKPKTANEAFGSISDFLLFFENRNAEIKDFANKFKEIEKMEEKAAMKELERVIIPQIKECFNEEFKKSDEYKKHRNKYSELLINGFKRWEEFYKEILHAYTINGFLYLHMNKYLRNEDWMELDTLLPYTYSLFKAFLWGPNGLTVQKNFESLKAKAEGNILILYRGADFDDESLNFYDPTKISNFSWNGVISTSLDKDIAIKFQGSGSKRPVLITIEIDFKILQPEDLNALYLAAFSAVPKEEEVAIPPGSIFELLEIKKGKPEVEMRLKLVTNAKVLAHKGQFLHGMLQAIMRNEDELKIVCLKEKELSRALKHCKGNRLIKDLEFCFCTFNEKAVGVFNEVIPTIENLTFLALNIVKLEESCHFDWMLKCIGRTGVKKLLVLATLSEKKHLEETAKGIKYLGSLEYLKLSFEEDCKMDRTLLGGLLKASCQYLNSQCIFNADFGPNENLMTKGSSLNDLEQFDVIKVLTQSWPSAWNCLQKKSPRSEKELRGFRERHSQKIDQGDTRSEENLKEVHDESVIHGENQFTMKIEQENDKGGFDKEPTRILNRLKIEEEKRTKNIEIYESLEAMKRYCLRDIENEILQKVLKDKFILVLQGDKQRDKILIVDLFFSRPVDENSEEAQLIQSLKSLYLSLQIKEIICEELSLCVSDALKSHQSQKTKALHFSTYQKRSDKRLIFCPNLQYSSSFTTLYLCFDFSNQITDEKIRSLSSKWIRNLPFLTSLHLDFSHCSEISDEGFQSLCFEGIKFLVSLTCLNLHFSNCNKITDESLKVLCSQGLQHLALLTSLYLDFSHCKSITDSGVKILWSQGIKYLVSLTCLSLSFDGCKKITNGTLNILCSQGNGHLIKPTSLPRVSWSWSRIFRCLPFRTISESKQLKINCHEPGRNDDVEIFSNRFLFQLSDLKRNDPFTVYCVNPGFYFKECPFKSESNISTLLKNYSLIDLKYHRESLRASDFSKQTWKNSHVIFHLDFKLDPIKDSLSDQKDAADNWQDTEALSLLLNDTNERLHKQYKNIILCFKSIIKLHLRSYKITISSIEVLESLIYEGIKSLKELKSINLIFPALELDEMTKNAICQSSSLALTFLTKRKISFQKQNFQISKNKSLIFHIQGEISSTQSQESESPIPSKRIFQKKDNFDSPTSIQNSQERLQSLPSVSLNFSEDLNVSMKGLSFEKFHDFKSLLILNLNFTKLIDMNNEVLKGLSERVRHLESLKTLNLIFYGCRRISDEGLLSLASKGLQQLGQLAELSLNFGFCNITDRGLKSLVCEGVKCPELLTKLDLNFDYCQSITHRGLKKLGHKVIRHLKLITDLRLSFKHCKEVSDLALEWPSQCLEFLTFLSLNFDGCQKISDQDILKLSLQGIKHLKSLTTLHLSFGGDMPGNITNYGVQYLCREGISYLNSLASLSLNFNIHGGLSDQGLESICCEAIQHLEALTSLELISRGQNRITERGIKSIAFNGMSRLVLLESLQLPLMTSVSSSSVSLAFARILTYFGMLKQEISI